MDDTATNTILATAGVASILLFALKGLLDQIPEMMDSASRFRDAWQRFKGPELPPRIDEELPPPADDEEPPIAA
ncbi:hypothetical protein ABTZ57_09590 [Streptomyces sp. NPDC094048]|uniref:hypothetical protein n=1 Tax=Streptomyces sp. NPDC094048 TaxID=3155207 RepID=UPI00331D0F9E